MTESERLRKEMEERGLLGTTGKKVIVSAAQKEINERKGGTAKSRLCLCKQDNKQDNQQRKACA